VSLGEFHCQELAIGFAPNEDRCACPSQNMCPVSFLFSEWSLARLSNTTNNQMFLINDFSIITTQYANH